VRAHAGDGALKDGARARGAPQVRLELPQSDHTRQEGGVELEGPRQEAARVAPVALEPLEAGPGLLGDWWGWWVGKKEGGCEGE